MSALTFTQALERAELLARQALPPALHGRLSCGMALVKAGAVVQEDGGLWTVASASTEGKRYSVNGSCSCEDAHYRAPKGRCKHKLAQYLARKTQALLHDEAQAPTIQGHHDNLETPPLYEAPASVNLKVLISGHEVMVTLRDADEGALLTRLAALLKRQDLRPLPPKPAPKSGGNWKRGNQSR
jgi:hypothetical protein